MKMIILDMPPHGCIVFLEVVGGKRIPLSLAKAYSKKVHVFSAV